MKSSKHKDRNLFPRSVQACVRWILVLAAAAQSSLARAEVWRGDYVPPPRPAMSRTRLGVYIFPGWYRDKGKGDYPYRTHDEDSEWRSIATYPKPRPLLGFYDDSLPEVNDWHIKWALEHGISFFAFDWYWNAGEHRLLRTLERGFLKAKYRRQIKFCIHWCNHGLDWRPRRWLPMMGLADFEVRGGVMKARMTSGDPAFACTVDIDASRYNYAVIRMKLDAGEMAQLFWTTSTRPESEKTSLRFKTIPDKKFHEYRLDLASVEAWRGDVIRLRLDPSSASPGSHVEVDYIRVLTQPDAAAGVSWEFNKERGGEGLTKWGLDFSREALVEMTEYMAENYFKLPNYLTIERRPVLIIWDARSLIEAQGGPSGFRRALAAMSQTMRSKGLNDLYLVAIHGPQDVPDARFAATTGYGYYGVNYDSKYEWRSGYSIPYGEMVKRHQTQWQMIAKYAELPYILAIGSNWDNRPRAGKNAAVITGKTPEKFRTMCQNSLKYIDKKLNIAIIEAWNEWGEGSFIEPDKEWGLAFLDVVRSVFTDALAAHVDCTPSPQKIASFSVLRGEELGRARETESKPMPDPPLLLRTVAWKIDEPSPPTRVLKRWEFDHSSSQGWMPYHVEPLTVRDGILSTTVTAPDPQLIVDNVGVAIEKLLCLSLRVRVSEGVSACQLFWSTKREPQLSADKAFTFRLRPDGQWHSYQVMKKVEGKWNGTLKILRLDIGNPGDRIEVDWIRLFGQEH